MQNLNLQQQEAVDTISGPLLVLAGAGAGKTKTIVERVINIIKNGTEPRNILCVTFTNKAAKEMLERIMTRLEEEGLSDKGEDNFYYKKNIPMIKTFHSLGLYILKEFGRELGFNKNISILDSSDTSSIIKNIIKGMDLDPKLHEPGKIKNAISREKSNWQSVDDYTKKISSFNMEIIEKVWRKYEEELKRQNAVDFDDLIIKTVELLDNNEKVRKYYQDKFKYIHVDEYQDTNNSQYEFVKNLVDPETKNICVVGDIDQNIYSWRGANLKNILHFEKDFPGAITIILEENYRSSKNILNLANNSIQKNKARVPKNLFTSKKEGEKIEVVPCFDERSEADFVAKKIKEIKEEKGVDYKDIAILYRTNFQSRIMEEGMIKNNLPYNLLGTKFFERKEVKDVMSYLRASQNRNNFADLKRVFETPKKGIGKSSLLKIFSGDTTGISSSLLIKIKSVYDFLDRIDDEIKLNNKKISEVIEMIIRDSGIEKELREGGAEEKERIENIRELVSHAKKYDEIENSEEALEIFLEETSLKSDQDDDEKNKDGVRLMTIHSAKGLEFDYVFLVGLEQDLFPHADLDSKKKTLEENEEERRLFYVAVTRARKKIFLCFAEMRTIYGEKRINIPSEFLEDVNTLNENEVNYNETYYGNFTQDSLLRLKNSFKKKSFFDDFKDDEFDDENVVEF